MQDNPFRITDLDTYIVYFFELPLGNVIKIGKTSIRNFETGIIETQRYFVDDVKLLGIEYCASQSDALEKEQELLRLFGRLRPRGELVQDAMPINHYIDCNCIDGSKELKKSKKVAREHNKQRKWNSRH